MPSRSSHAAGAGSTAAASRAAYSADSAPDAYAVRGQKKPRRPSPLVRGTTCTCRCGTDWETRLLTATKVPPAPSPSRTATVIRWTAAKNGPSRSGGNSSRVSACSRGATSTCPLKTGRMSRKAPDTSSDATPKDGTSPAAMAQKRHSVTTITLAGSSLDGMQSDQRRFGFDTLAIHAGQEPDP